MNTAFYCSFNQKQNRASRIFNISFRILHERIILHVLTRHNDKILPSPHSLALYALNRLASCSSKQQNNRGEKYGVCVSIIIFFYAPQTHLNNLFHVHTWVGWMAVTESNFHERLTPT